MRGGLRTRLREHGQHPAAPRAPKGNSGLMFRPELARLVRAGVKTETRRIVKPYEQTYRLDVGDEIAVQPGRGKHAICRVRIEDVDRQRLGDLDFRAAIAEGFRTTAEFFGYWRRLHKLGLPDRHRDLLERLVDAPTALHPSEIHPGLSTRALARRLSDLERQALTYRESDGRWEITDRGGELLTDEFEGIDLDTRVWVVRFALVRRLDEDPPRLLALDHVGDEHGYTTVNALAVAGVPATLADGREVVVPEPEVIDSTSVAKSWRHHAEQDRAEALLGGLERRLANARARAAAKGMDIRDHERAISERVNRLERALEAA